MNTWYEAIYDNYDQYFYSYHNDHDLKEKLFNEFCEKFQVNKMQHFDASPYHKYDVLLSGYRSFHTGKHPDMRVPNGIDHRAIFRTTYGVKLLVFHPYHAEPDEALLEWLKRWRLKLKIYDKKYSWYYPGGTFLAVIYNPEFMRNIDEMEESDAENIL